MRLGSYPCAIVEGSKVHSIYKQNTISERHRHRFEFNNFFMEDFNNNGMTCSGINPNNNLVEIIEYKEHPWFIGVQFHPEYKSTVIHPHPLFVDFIKATSKVNINQPTLMNGQNA